MHIKDCEAGVRVAVYDHDGRLIGSVVSASPSTTRQKRAAVPKVWRPHVGR
jgi:hypothetical protein